MHAKQRCSSFGPCRTLLRPVRRLATRVGGAQRPPQSRRQMPIELQLQHRLQHRGRFRGQAQGSLPLRQLQSAVSRQARGGAPIGTPPLMQPQSLPACLLDAAAGQLQQQAPHETPLSSHLFPSSRSHNQFPAPSALSLPSRQMSAPCCCCSTHSIRLCTSPPRQVQPLPSQQAHGCLMLPP